MSLCVPESTRKYPNYFCVCEFPTRKMRSEAISQQPSGSQEDMRKQMIEYMTMTTRPADNVKLVNLCYVHLNKKESRKKRCYPEHTIYLPQSKAKQNLSLSSEYPETTYTASKARAMIVMMQHKDGDDAAQ